MPLLTTPVLPSIQMAGGTTVEVEVEVEKWITEVTTKTCCGIDEAKCKQ